MEDSSGDDIEGNEEAEEIRQDKAAEEESEIFEPRRSQRERRKPGYLNDYVAFAMSAEAFIEDIPRDYEEVKRRSDKGKWNEAITEKIRALEENGTWTKLPPGKKLIDNKWVFKIKRNEINDEEQFKARLVAKGFTQRKGSDYYETYAPVAHQTTVRILLAVINHRDLIARQFDVKNAFLHGYLKEVLYMRQPQGFERDPTLVCKLNKSQIGRAHV